MFTDKAVEIYTIFLVYGLVNVVVDLQSEREVVELPRQCRNLSLRLQRIVYPPDVKCEMR